MNLKRLEQLVRLANNNPNENEANLAARKACKLIEESKFKFAEDAPLRGKSPVQPNWNDPFQNGSFWEHFARGQWSQSYNPPPPRPEPQPRYNPPPPYKEEEGKYEWYVDSDGRQRKRIRPEYKRKIVCSGCGKEYDTGFVGNPATFQCFTCQWVDFNKSRGSQL